MRTAFAAVVLSVLLVPLHALADTSGNKLKLGLEANLDSSLSDEAFDEAIVKKTFSVGYVSGVADALHYTSFICEPDGVSPQQEADVVLKFLKDHPERLHHHQVSLVTVALLAAFPCAPKPPKTSSNGLTP